MTKSVSLGPFQKLDDSHQLRSHPHALLHLFGVQNLAPSGASGFGQIHKWAFVGNQRLQPLVNRPTRCWYKTVSRSGDINEIIAVIVTQNYAVEAVYSRRESPDDKFLPAIVELL
jgi:hypothetical protein